MRTLIIATNKTNPDVEYLIKTARHHRVDYLELGQLPDNGYIDYNPIPANHVFEWIENTLRMDMRQALLAAEIVRKEGYDQVFSMSERVGIPLALLLPRDVRHIVQMAHGLSVSKLMLINSLKLAERWHKIIVPTHAEASALRSAFGKNKDRVVMLYYPVDTDFYQPQENPAPASQADHFESLGLSTRDYPTLIRAVRRLPDIPCHIRSGSSWYSYQAALGYGRLPANVRLQPFVAPAVLRDCYLQSRFTVLPLWRTTQWSAGCTTAMQSQSMGRAVIATSTPGMAEYIEDGKTGLLVAPGNVKEMADAIAYLWKNPQIADEMGCNGFQRIREIFSMDQWMRAITQIL